MHPRQPSRLAGYDHWETRDPDEAALAISQGQRNFRQEIRTGQGYFFSSHTVEMEWLTLSSILILPPQRAWAEADGRHYMLAFWNDGWNDFCFNRRQGRVASGEGLLSSPYLDSYWKTGVSRDVIAASIPTTVLLKEAENLAGRPISRLEPTGMLQKQGPIWRLLNHFLGYLESGLFRKPSLLRRERERSLITAVVALAPHNIRFREERAHNTPQLHKLRCNRAEEYMEAHLTDAISISDLATAAGVSAKSLQRAFRQCCGETWVRVLWKMRMDATRHDLLAPEQYTTVISVAKKYGFHPGRFPAQYFDFHGEYPHVTLKLGRLGPKLY